MDDESGKTMEEYDVTRSRKRESEMERLG